MGRRWRTSEKLLVEGWRWWGAEEGAVVVCLDDPPQYLLFSLYVNWPYFHIKKRKKERKRSFSVGFQTPIHLEKSWNSRAVLRSEHKKPTGSLTWDFVQLQRITVQTTTNSDPPEWLISPSVLIWRWGRLERMGRKYKYKRRVSTIGPAWPDIWHQVRLSVYVASFSFWRKKKCQQLENVCNVNTAVLAQLQGKHTRT